MLTAAPFGTPVNLTPIHTLFGYTYSLSCASRRGGSHNLTNKNPLTYVVAVRDSNPLHVTEASRAPFTAFTQQHPPALFGIYVR